MSNEDRYERGERMLKQLYGDVGAVVLEGVRANSPDLERFITEFAFGDVFSRPALDLRSREIATIAVLSTQGNAASPLRAHIHGAMNIGVTREEIVELMIQMAVYAGFPTAIHGLTVAGQVFRERDAGKNS